MGVGKTVVACTVITELLEGDPALIVAPKLVARDVWPQEIKEWDHLRGIEIVAINGTEAERIEAMQTRAHIYTVSYDNLPWLADTLEGRWPFPIVIPDESTRLKGFRLQSGSVRAATLSRVAHQEADRWINLTGTPAPNGLLDLWGPQWFIDGGGSLGRSFDAYKRRWFYGDPNSPQKRWTPFRHSQEEIQAALAYSTMSIELPGRREPIVYTRWVELPPAVRRQYNSMKNHLYSEMAQGLVTAKNAGVKTEKLLQLASGAIYHEDGATEFVHDEKVLALESIITEAAGQPILVAYTHRFDAQRIKEKFPFAREIREKDAIHQWNAGALPVMLAHPASAGHGLNLQHGGNIICYYGCDWNLEHHDQILERIGPLRQAQSGYDRPVFVYYIRTRNTIDEQVRERIETKADVMDLLMKAMAQDQTATADLF